MNDQPSPKRQKTNMDDSAILASFLNWLDMQEIKISPKLKLRKLSSHSRFGAVATDNISSGDILFTIPRDVILWERNCAISSSLVETELNDESGWVKLILCVMYEHTNKNSKWLQYMQFLPPCACMDQPMFWTAQHQLNFLKGTGVYEAVSEDVKKIENEYYEFALPFIKRHSLLGFDSNVHTLDLYKHMVAVVMAYSFTEQNNQPSSPMMVPLADALNHISHNNAELEFQPKHLIMRATQDIKSGDEIYNTYGQLSNAQLLQMYGFVERYPNNIYDTVDIELSLFFACAIKLNIFPNINEKQDWMEQRGFPSSSFITIGLHGILTLTQFKLIAKILPLSEEEFDVFKQEEDEEWESEESSDDEDVEFEVFPFRKVKHLGRSLRSCIRSVAEICFIRFDQSIVDCDATDSDVEDVDMCRKARCQSLVYGQRRLLTLLMEATDGKD